MQIQWWKVWIFCLPLVGEGRVASLPDHFSVSGGVFDLLRPRHRTAEFSIEYKFHSPSLRFYQWLDLDPFLGFMATVRGSTYVYGGLDFELVPIDCLVIAPGFAAGWYQKGHGKNLGFPLEFRSGIKLAWQWSNQSRAGIHFYHISNASLGKRNPGEESLVFFYDIPIKKGFPFL